MTFTIKFSQMMSGGDIAPGAETPGLLMSNNVLFNNPWTFLAPGSTASRPVPSSAIDGRLRFNTDSLTYEYYDTLSATWVELSGSGTGTVNPGTTNSVAFYAANGTAVSPTNSANLAVLGTNGSGFPAFSTTLPTGLSIPSATITASTAALTSGQVVAAPVNPTDIANKAYVDSSFGAGVTSITGTTNQVIASAATGAVTLSLPQDIATGSTPTFAGLTLSSIPLSPASGGTGINNSTNTLTLAGNLATIGAFASNFTMTAATNVTFPTSGTLATTSQLPTPSALTEVNDTNVTMTLGGTPTTALLQAVSMTLGWTGTLAVGRGGLGINTTPTNGQIPIGNGTNYTAAAITPGTGISVTNGSGTITIAATAGVATSFITDSGTATPAANALTITGSSTGLTTTGSSSTVGLTGTLAIGHGGTGVTSVTIAPAATAFAGWDANKNLSANSFLSAYTTTATAAGTTTLTVASTYQQFFTGSTTQTVVMPVTSTLVLGQSWYIVNNSSGIVTLQSSGLNNILAMAPNTSTVITCILASGTTAASWSVENTSSSGGVTSITGTTNQVIASAATGAVTLSLPQSIATSSGVTFGSVTFSSTSGIIGTTTNNNAAAGSVGELISSVISSGSPVSFTSGSSKDLTSISLTAGDWDVFGNITGISTSASTIAINVWISLTSATLPDSSLRNLVTSSSAATGLNAPFFRASLSGTTTVYLSANIGATGTLTGQGGIYARRVR